MIYCHEWVQVTDGAVGYVRLKDDLSAIDGEPKNLFRASYVNHSWGKPIPPDGSGYVGGEGSPKAIEQIIDLIRPEATISLLGVSENPVPVNTRMVLEKGLRLFGSSRSGRRDFENTVAFFKEHPETVGYLSNIVGQVVDVRKIEDAHTAFKLDMQKSFGKTVMHWNI